MNWDSRWLLNFTDNMNFIEIKFGKGSIFNDDSKGIHYTFTEDVTFHSKAEMNEYFLKNVYDKTEINKDIR